MALFGRHRAGISIVGGAVAAMMLVVGCSAAQFQYATNNQLGVYFKVPSKWKSYNPNTLIQTFDASSSGGAVSQQGAAALLSQEWQVAYDGSGKPTAGHLVAGSQVPVVRVKVVPILSGEKETFSISNLRAADLFNPTTLGQAIQAEENHPAASAEELVQPSGIQTLEDTSLNQSGFFGVHYVFNLRLNSGELETFDITGWADTALTHEYFMVVTCTNLCYTENQSTIDSITSSFTVRGT